MSTIVDKIRQYSKPGYYDEFDYHWTMTIDLDRCTGCEACVVACQAENNLPIVGEKQFALNREIKWIRIERYWEGDYPDIKMGFIPMLCQQCDDAPCETACPVFATYHIGMKPVWLPARQKTIYPLLARNNTHSIAR